MPYVIAVLLAIGASVFVLMPLTTGQYGANGSLHEEGPTTVADDAAARNALRDLDFDYRLGNIQSDDYTAMRDRYERAALDSLKQRYELERSVEAAIESDLADARRRFAVSESTMTNRAESSVKRNVISRHMRGADGPSERRRTRGTKP